MKTLISIIGLTALAGMTIGTAIAIIGFGWVIALKIFVASLLCFVFSIIIHETIEGD